jgi:L-ribulose-5-phosphate 3-epimerase
MKRRDFIMTTAAATLAETAFGAGVLAGRPKQLWRVSLCEYSLHRTIPSKVDPLDFGPFTREQFDIEGVDYWNIPFKSKANDSAYLAEMKKRSDEAGVIGGVILVDGEGNLGDPNVDTRKQAVQNHHKWIDAANKLGCYAIRVNARSAGSYEEQMKLAADGLGMLSDYGKQNRVAVIVENHGGLSSNGEWLAGVMRAVDNPYCGTLPDFGNFHNYDRYKGVEETMPWAKNVSAKSHAFDENGNEKSTDYYRMMKIVVDSGFRGWVGIEYEGAPPEVDGVRKTHDLLKRVHEKLIADMG